jgi:hypothetical protein
MTQRLTLVGPNLPRPLCDRGTFHVHEAGCRDLHRGMLGACINGVNEYTANFRSRLEVESFVYDFAPEENEDYTLGDYQYDFHFAPCVTIPVEIPRED